MMRNVHRFLLPSESDQFTMWEADSDCPQFESACVLADAVVVDDVEDPRRRCVFCRRDSPAPLDHGLCLGAVDWCECPCGTGEFGDPLAVPPPRAG